jgi:transposase
MRDVIALMCLFASQLGDCHSCSQDGSDMMTRKRPEMIEMDVAKLDALLHRAEEGTLAKEDHQTIRAVFESYAYLTQLIDQKSTTIRRLRTLLFGASTESTAAVIGREASSVGTDSDTQPSGDSQQDGTDRSTSSRPNSPRKKGHGRNGADDYPGANRVPVSHASLKAGDSCPQCPRGTVYQVSQPGILLRFVGQPPVQATVYELQKLRCSVCGTVFTADPPADIGTDKYDATVASMIAALKYGKGFPFNRIDGLQENLKVPLPASTQWEIVSGPISDLKPVYQELIRQAAQGEVVHNDDTTVKILELMGKGAQQQAFEEAAHQDHDHQDDLDSDRTGLFTSGVVATTSGQRIALFFSGRKHAGENLMDVLRERAADLPPPIQMCDALSRNMPAELKTIVANCLAHGRRQFVDLSATFRSECQYVLETLEVVYRNDALARERQLSPSERLTFHQAESGPPMERLREWLKRQFDDRLVEPNSALGAAINYLRNHWDKLTLFLRVPGAPLDNNVCERALKKAILHRKNSLFYKTRNGASVGDLYMSLIYTCELCGANAFDYLTELQRHASQIAAAPAAWFPWNYRQNLANV